MIGRRPRSVLIPPETAVPFPMACPAAGQRSGTICREANRKYSGRRHIPPRRPEEYSFRYHSCSTRVPVYASGGAVGGEALGPVNSIGECQGGKVGGWVSTLTEAGGGPDFGMSMAIIMKNWSADRKLYLSYA